MLKERKTWIFTDCPEWDIYFNISLEFAQVERQNLPGCLAFSMLTQLTMSKTLMFQCPFSQTMISNFFKIPLDVKAALWILCARVWLCLLGPGLPCHCLTVLRTPFRHSGMGQAIADTEAIFLFFDLVLGCTGKSPKPESWPFFQGCFSFLFWIPKRRRHFNIYAQRATLSPCRSGMRMSRPRIIRL